MTQINIIKYSRNIRAYCRFWLSPPAAHKFLATQLKLIKIMNLLSATQKKENDSLILKKTSARHMLNLENAPFLVLVLVPPNYYSLAGLRVNESFSYLFYIIDS